MVLHTFKVSGRYVRYFTHFSREHLRRFGEIHINEGRGACCSLLLVKQRKSPTIQQTKTYLISRYEIQIRQRHLCAMHRSTFNNSWFFLFVFLHTQVKGTKICHLYRWWYWLGSFWAIYLFTLIHCSLRFFFVCLSNGFSFYPTMFRSFFHPLTCNTKQNKLFFHQL